jgi:hypothetical protein
MSDLKDRVKVFRALDEWFDSQNIEISDRAFHCAQAAGVYLGSDSAGGDVPHLRKGLSILGKVLIQSTVTTYKHFRQETYLEDEEDDE